MATQNLFGDLALEATQQDVLEGVLDDSSTEEVVAVLQAILSRLGYPDQANGSLRVTPTGTTAISGSLTTVTTVTTVATVTNQAQMGGLSAIYDQYSNMMMNAGVLRAQISVT